MSSEEYLTINELAASLEGESQDYQKQNGFRDL
jgi:hypothetical protein